MLCAVSLFELCLASTVLLAHFLAPFAINPKLVDSLEQEKMAAVAELEEELVAEACNELELHAQRQAR